MDRRITRGGRATCAAVLSALFLATASHAQLVELVSKADPGNLEDTTEGDVTGISADGRYVLFESTGSNLVPGQVDLMGTTDVFLRDRVSGTTVLVSHVPGSSVESVNDTSVYSTMNADGSYVFFLSRATNLVPGQIDTNSQIDAFLWERATDTVTLVSHTAASTTTAGDGGTWWPNAPSPPLTLASLFDDVISADGSFLVFASDSTDLVAGQIDTNGDTDIFLYERTTGTTTLVSHQALVPATAGDSGCSTAHISADGAVVVFSSAATNLVAGQFDANFTSDVFVYDRLSGNIFLASHTGDFVTTGDGYARDPEVSADSAFVAFIGTASNLVAGQVDTNFQDDVFVYDVGSQSVTLVSHTDSSPLTTGDSFSGMGGGWEMRGSKSARTAMTSCT